MDYMLSIGVRRIVTGKQQGGYDQVEPVCGVFVHRMHCLWMAGFVNEQLILLALVDAW